jgi:hypothetical protein
MSKSSKTTNWFPKLGETYENSERYQNSIEKKLLEKYTPLTLNVEKIGYKFIFVIVNNVVYGTLIDFISGTPDVALIRNKTGKETRLSLTKNLYKIFSLEEIRENIIKKDLEKILPKDLVPEILEYDKGKGKGKGKKSIRIKSRRNKFKKSRKNKSKSIKR